jgi:hypothetical protein
MIDDRTSESYTQFKALSNLDGDRGCGITFRPTLDICGPGHGITDASVRPERSNGSDERRTLDGM